MGKGDTAHAAILEGIETLLQEEDNAEAARQLQSIDATGLSEDETGQFLLLSIQANINIGTYDHDLVERALQHFRYDKKAFGFARVKLLLGWMLSKEGRISESREVLNEAAATFLLIGQPEHAASACNQIANDAVVGGSFILAIEKYLRALDLFTEAGAKRKARDVVLNLAYVYSEYGRLREARERFEFYEAECGEDLSGDREYHHNIADLYVQLGATGNAREHLEAASQCIGGSKRGTIVNRHILTKCHYFDGEFRLAHDSARIGLQLADEIGSDLRPCLRRWLADAYLEFGNTKMARKEIILSMRLAQTSGQLVEVGACCRTLARIAIREGNKDQAREQFEESIRILSQIESLYELARTNLVAGQSSLFDQTRADGMKKMAADYFKSQDAIVPTVGIV